jgi:hypothetical protein
MVLASTYPAHHKPAEPLQPIRIGPESESRWLGTTRSRWCHGIVRHFDSSFRRLSRCIPSHGVASVDSREAGLDSNPSILVPPSQARATRSGLGGSLILLESKKAQVQLEMHYSRGKKRPDTSNIAIMPSVMKCRCGSPPLAPGALPPGQQYSPHRDCH